MPDDKEKKKRVKVELFTTDKDVAYKGRLLGLIKTDEFAALVNNKELQSKFYTSGTIPLSYLAGYDDLKGFRLVVAVKEINDVVVPKQLFVSDKLHMVSVAKKNEVGLTTESDDWLIINEKEV